MKATLRRLRAHPWLTGSVVVLIVAGASVGGYFGTQSDSAGAASPTTTTSTETVSTGTVKQSVSATGTLAPADEENLNFPVSGQVTAVSVTEGQTVKKGQTLATIDSASLSAAVAQAQATVTNDQAKVDADGTNGASSTQTAADNAALTAAQQQVSSAQSQLASATMTSPIDGVVATVNITAGQSVSGSNSANSSSSSSNSGSGSGRGGALSGAATNNSNSSSSSDSSASPQILVISTNSWVVNATVDDTSVGLIQKGDQAQLSVTGTTQTVYGTIGSIGLVASSTSGVASYPVNINVTGSPTGLHDGASVTATLIYKQVSNVVVVPTLALHRNSTGGEYVEKVVNGKTVQTTVQTGISSGGETQIVSGVAAGDKISVPQLRAARGSGTGGAGRLGGNFPGGGEGRQFGGGGGFGGGFGGGGGLGRRAGGGGGLGG